MDSHAAEASGSWQTRSSEPAKRRRTRRLPADRRPDLHGAQPVDLNAPPSRTSKKSAGAMAKARSMRKLRTVSKNPVMRKESSWLNAFTSLTRVRNRAVRAVTVHRQALFLLPKVRDPETSPDATVQLDPLPAIVKMKKYGRELLVQYALVQEEVERTMERHGLSTETHWTDGVWAMASSLERGVFPNFLAACQAEVDKASRTTPRPAALQTEVEQPSRTAPRPAAPQAEVEQSSRTTPQPVTPRESVAPIVTRPPRIVSGGARPKESWPALTPSAAMGRPEVTESIFGEVLEVVKPSFAEVVQTPKPAINPARAGQWPLTSMTTLGSFKIPIRPHNRHPNFGSNSIERRVEATGAPPGFFPPTEPLEPVGQPEEVLSMDTIDLPSMSVPPARPLERPEVVYQPSHRQLGFRTQDSDEVTAQHGHLIFMPTEEAREMMEFHSRMRDLIASGRSPSSYGEAGLAFIREWKQHKPPH